MRENRVKSALKAGKAVVGAGLSIAANPAVVRLMAAAGYDFLFIDTEHALLSPETLLAVVQTARASGISPIVRVQDTEYHLIANFLDSGADGIIVPRVNSRAQAERAAQYARFPPLGVRGCASIAPLDYYRPNWAQAVPWINEQTLVTVQIESKAAVEAVDDIVQARGLDLIFLGPLDLSISLGIPGQTEHPHVISAMEHVIERCLAAGMPVGTVMPTPEALKHWWEKGMRFLVCGGDSSMLLAGATANVQGVRAFAG